MYLCMESEKYKVFWGNFFFLISCQINIYKEWMYQGREIQ